MARFARGRNWSVSVRLCSIGWRPNRMKPPTLHSLGSPVRLRVVVLAIKYRNNLPSPWAFLLGVCFLVAGVWRLLGQTSRMPERDFVRLRVWCWAASWNSDSPLSRPGLTWNWWVVSGGCSLARQEGWRLWVVLLALVAGLAVMFISLQFCRGDELLRRSIVMIFAALPGVWLLLLVLVVLNIWSMFPGDRCAGSTRRITGPNQACWVSVRVRRRSSNR